MKQALELMELVDWMRVGLEGLMKSTDDEFIASNLETLIRACDPDTNPRLRRILAELDISESPEER